MTYTNRIIEHKLREYLNFFSVVGLTGPRQSGKSTLLLNELKDYRYVSFDDPQTLDFFAQDPTGFLTSYSDKIIFDEVQKAPKIFDSIKLAVDKDREQTGKYVLTGSSQFSMVQGVSESLAGRIGLLSLLPFQYAEIPKNLRAQAVFRGSYPELVNKSYQMSQDWYAAYLNTYLSKDVRALSQLGDVQDFLRFMHLLAAHTSQVLNMSRFATDIGVDVKTIKRWLSVLEASYVIFLLQPYHGNTRKRLIKSPKVYFHDTGLVAYLTGITDHAQYAQGPLAGPLFENYVISEILKYEWHLKTHAKLYYLRTSDGIEVDLVIDRNTHREWIEIKSGSTFKRRMLKPIETFIQDHDEGYLLYNGDALPSPQQQITVLPYTDYLMQRID